MAEGGSLPGALVRVALSSELFVSVRSYAFHALHRRLVYLKHKQDRSNIGKCVLLTLDKARTNR